MTDRELNLRHEINRCATIAKDASDPTNARFWARLAAIYARTLQVEGWTK